MTSSDPMKTGGVPAAHKCRNPECDAQRVYGAYYCERCERNDPRLLRRLGPSLESGRTSSAAPNVQDLNSALEMALERGPSLQGDAQARKAAPMFEGLKGYFPNALAYVAHVSKVGNEQHNPGQPMHWAFDKSTDEKDCIERHLAEAGTLDTDGLRHSAKVAWRALANLERELLASDPTLKPGVNVKGFVRK